MKQASFEGHQLERLSIEATALNNQVSFRDYLIKSGYTEFSPRLYMKENPLELIRLFRKDGHTHFRNFENKNDKGRLLDFIRHRSLEEGKVLPNTAISALQVAITKAKAFIKENVNVIPKHLKKGRVVAHTNYSLRV